MNFHEKVLDVTSGFLPVFICDGCGGLVSHTAEDVNKHTKFHEALVKTANAANYADSMMRPLA